MTIVLGVLIFINVVLFIIIIFIGGLIMETIKANIDALNAAITALQGRIGTGVLVQQSELDSVASSIAQATTTIGSIAA